jgi:hypothetical protein
LWFTALLANADAATFNLLRRGWFIPSDNNGPIVDRTVRRRSEARGIADNQFPALVNQGPAQAHALAPLLAAPPTSRSWPRLRQELFKGSS